MTDPDDLGRWLHTHRAALTGGDAPGPHPPDERWAELVEGGLTLSAAERDHLSRCAECRAVFAAVAHVAAPAAPAPRPRRAWLPAALGLAAAAAAAFLLLRPGPGPVAPDAGTFSPRGAADAGPAAEVALLVTDAAGHRRDLTAGARVAPTDRLGVVYGNLAGAHRTLVVLGLAGGQVQWYHPERAGLPGVALLAGPDARARRLPVDVGLEDHPPGPLRIVAAFDAAPDAVAAALQAGDPIPGARVQTWDVTVEAK